MNAIPNPLSAADPDVSRLIGLLDEEGSTPPTAVSLMRGVGIEFKQAGNDIWAPVIPQTAYVAFICLAMRANAALRAFGFELKRSGGRPSDRYWIEPHGASPSN